MYVREINQRIKEIQQKNSFIYPSEKPSALDEVIKEQLSFHQRAVYSVIIELKEEKERYCSLLSKGELGPYESLLYFSILNLKIKALQSTLWTSLFSDFENKLKPGDNEISIKKNFCLCLSHFPNGYKGEKEIFYLGLPD